MMELSMRVNEAESPVSSHRAASDMTYYQGRGKCSTNGAQALGGRGLIDAGDKRRIAAARYIS